jgi:hypothetical protein
LLTSVVWASSVWATTIGVSVLTRDESKRMSPTLTSAEIRPEFTGGF